MPITDQVLRAYINTCRSRCALSRRVRIASRGLPAKGHLDLPLSASCKLFSSSSSSLSFIAEPTSAPSTTKSWSSTLLLPRSTFPARPSADDRPKFLARCTDELYIRQKVRNTGQGQSDVDKKDEQPFVLHDGPPYANGQLHVGHALNKIVKDVTLRVQLAKGRSIEYVPGWDCHGLPIELKALQRRRERKEHKHDVSANGSGLEREGNRSREAKTEQERGAEVEGYDAVAVRSLARDLATETVKEQRESFRQWGVIGDWDNYWTTMQPDFELRQLNVFRQMLNKDLIYRRFKPVYWSSSSRTALAEGELEYKPDHTSIAAFVAFEAADQATLARTFEINGRLEKAIKLLIWTTTPWTLPSNKAIAVRNDLSYICAYFEGFGHLVIAESRLEQVEALCRIRHKGPVYGPISGQQLVNAEYLNGAFTSNQKSRVLHADYVSEDSGTGLVHTAPGHGMDDYKLCLQKGIEPFTPVDDHGRFTADAFSDDSAARHLVGSSVQEEGNVGILKVLKQQKSIDGMLLVKSYKYTHSYPYDWRSKQPIIIRATAQWFADLGEIRDTALQALEDVRFIPPSGRERLASTVRNRTEWCISRQRAWGVPIPALYEKESGKALLTPESVAHVIATIRERGIDSWWTDTEDEVAWILPAHRGTGVKYVRGRDTMDVWFDSGSSWTHMGKEEGDAARFSSRTADVYLEGSDQHRGWFQSSILTKVAFDSAQQREITEQQKKPASPFKTLITHGFTLDDKGRKMSKSEGNVVSPDDIINGTLLPPMKPRKGEKKQAGAPPIYDSLGPDALRLLVAGCDYTKDIQIGPTVLKTLHSNLAKLRVTFRLLTGLLADFDALRFAYRSHSVDDVQSQQGPIPRISDLGLVNQLALLDLQSVTQRVWRAFEELEYHRGVAAVNEYVNSDLSAFYIEAVKDRMYTDSAVEEGGRRATAQFVLWHIFEELCAMLRPVCPLLVEEAVAHLPVKRNLEESRKLSQNGGGKELGLTADRLLRAADVDSDGRMATVLQLNQATPAISSTESHGSTETQFTLQHVGEVAPLIRQLDAAVKALLETERARKTLGSSLQAHATVWYPDSPLSSSSSSSPPTPSAALFSSLLKSYQPPHDLESELADIFVVSKVSCWSIGNNVSDDKPDDPFSLSSSPSPAWYAETLIEEEGPAKGFRVAIHAPPTMTTTKTTKDGGKEGGAKCHRCWKYTAAEELALCARCESVVGENCVR